MPELSPAAQAVIDTWWNASDGEYINGVWTPNRSAQLAAALRAAVDCLWVDKPDGANGVYETHRAQLLAIADELEAQ
jgi:hypothetical protein